MPEYLPPTIPGTDPTTWEGWMELINSLQDNSVMIPEDQQIVIKEAFEVWCQAHKITPIYTVRQVLTGFGEVVNPSPTTGTDIIVRPITTLVPVAGGNAVAEVVKNGGNAWGLIKKNIVLAAVTAMFVSSVGAFQVSDENRARMEAVVDDFTVDGENVPVLIDRSGNTFLQNDLLEAMRAEMVNMGAFSTGGVEKEGTLNYSQLPDSIFPFQTYAPGEIVRYIGNNALMIVRTSPVNYVRFDYDDGGDTVQVVLMYSDMTFTYTDGSTTRESRYSFTHDGRTVHYDIDTRWIANNLLPDHPSVPEPVFTLNIRTLTTETCNTLAWLAQYNRGAGGVEGITPAADLIQNGVTDLTKTLHEVIPDLGTSIKTATPTDTDLYDQTDWDPISLLGKNPFTDGLTETDHENATEGKPDEKSQEELLETIKQLIADYFPDPTYPVPDPDPTPEPAPPVLDGSSNGLWAIYNPTKQEVKDFGAWLWSDSIIDQIERQFKNSPIDAVIGFHQIYCTPITGADKTIKAGYLDSPVAAPEVTNQYADIDCGTVSVTEYYHNAIDYMMTKISLYLPFIGFVPLDAGIVMGSQVNIRYRIDVLTGTCIAQVRVLKSGATVVYYNYQGNCAVQIPLTASTYTGIVGALMGAVTAGVSVMTGNAAGAFTGVKHTVSSLAQGHQIQQSGSLGSNAGALGIRIPYMIIARPIQQMPSGYAGVQGIPSNHLVKLSECTGYTRVSHVHLQDIPCTDDELEMIERELKDGVVIV